MAAILLIGALLGNWVGALLVDLLPAFSEVGRVQTIGIPYFTMDLEVISFSFGLTIRVGLFTLLGIVGAYLVYRRM